MVLTQLQCMVHTPSYLKYVQLAYTRKYYSTQLSCNILKASSTKSPVVLAHGVLGNKNNFNSLAKKLLENTGRSVISYDARNHGKSDHSNVMTLSSMSEDLVELLEKLKISECILLGHSMGGRVAMYTALNYPEYINKLVVVDSSPVAPFNLASTSDRSSVVKYVKAMKLVTWSNFKTLSEARSGADAQIKPVVTDPGIRAFILTNVEEKLQGNFGWRVNLHAICEHLEQSSHIDTPASGLNYQKETYFIGGGNSYYIGFNDYPIIKRLFPKAMISHIPEGGHWIHSEKPTEFLHCLVGFLKPTTFPLFTT